MQNRYALSGFQSLMLLYVQEEDKGPGAQSTPEDITKAKEAIAAALTAIREAA